MAAFPLVSGDHAAPRGSLVCSVCGYGVARETPPGPCPMCRADDAWAASTRRPFATAGDAGHGEWTRDAR